MLTTNSTNIKVVSPISTYYRPLWGNTILNIPFNTSWFNKKISNIGHMYNEKDNPLLQNEVDAIIGKSIHVFFSQVHAFCTSLSREGDEETRDIP